MKRHGFHGVGASHGAHRNHRKPGSIGACATPGRVFKGVRMAGRMGGDPVTTQNVDGARRRRREGPDPAQGRRSRPQGRPRGHPLRGQGPHRPRRSPLMTERKTVEGRLPGRDLRRPGQHPADPPGRRGPAGRRPPGHPRHQDPWRGPRRWPQALQAEGHRPRPPGLDPRAAVRRRWRGPRADAAQLRPAHPQEDEGRRAAWRPLRPGPRRPRARGRGLRRAATSRAPRTPLAALAGAHRPAAHARRARAGRRHDLAVAAQRGHRPPARRRPAQHLRRAALRRRGLHQGRLRRVRGRPRPPASPSRPSPPRPRPLRVAESEEDAK